MFNIVLVEHKNNSDVILSMKAGAFVFSSKQHFAKCQVHVALEML